MSFHGKSDNDARVLELEIRLSFQDKALHTLNEVVTRQQLQITSLVREIEILKDRIRAATPSPVGPFEDEKPPPHY